MAIAPKVRDEFALKKLRRTFYRYVGEIVHSINFVASSWNMTGEVSFTGHYFIGHIFESRLYQNTDDHLDPARISSFESQHLGRWQIKSDEDIDSVAAQIVVDIRDRALPAFAAYSSVFDYASTLRMHPADGDGDRLRQIKVRIYSGDFAGARADIDEILAREDFSRDDVWLRAQVRLLYPYIERKSPNQALQHNDHGCHGLC